MTNQEKIQYLKQYRMAVAGEARLRAEREEWRSLAEKTTSTLSGMPRGGGGPGRMVTAVEHIAQIEEQLDAAIRERVRQRLTIHAAIQRVPEERLRYLLERRYVDGATWEQIALDMDITYQWTCALHKKAIALIEVDILPVL